MYDLTETVKHGPGFLNQYLATNSTWNRINPLGPLYFREMGFKLSEGVLQWGFDLDPVYEGSN